MDDPAGGREAVAGGGDDDQIGPLEGEVDGVAPSAAHGHGAGQEAVEQRPPSRAPRTGHGGARVRRRPAGPAVGAGRRPDPDAGPQGQHRADHVALVEPGQGAPGRVAVLDDHAGQGGADGRFERALPALVDLDQFHQ